LQNNTFSGLFVGQHRVTLSAVDSTNSYLKEALSNSAPFPEGTVIMAEEQFAGRGQASNSWISDPGKNLTFSILLKPVFLQPSRQFELNKAISLALNDVLNGYFPGLARIKWPNDAYIGDKKIAGVLIENMVQGSQIKHCIVGIGLNVNQQQYPSELPNATSFYKILQSDVDLTTVLGEICSAIERRYLQLRAGNDLTAEYVSQLYRLRQPASFRVESQFQTGTITGITDSGLLEIEIDGIKRQFGLKEVEFIVP